MNTWQRAVWNPHTGKVELRDVAEYRPAELSEHERLTRALDAAQDEIERLRADYRSVVKSLEDKRDRDTNPDTSDYLLAMTGEGPHAEDWGNKPHRLIYDLINKVTAITRQRDDARDIAIRCGAWQNGAGADYEAHLDTSLNLPLVDPDGLLFGGGS